MDRETLDELMGAEDFEGAVKEYQEVEKKERAASSSSWIERFENDCRRDGVAV